MPTFPQGATVFLGGLVAGFSLASGLCLAWRTHSLRLRRMVLGFSARALVDALARLEDSIETHALDPDLLREVAGCRDLAAAVARVTEE